MPDARTLPLFLLLLAAPALAACAVGESAPPPISVEPVAPPPAVIADTGTATPAPLAPAAVAAADPSARQRWDAPFAVTSSGRTAPRPPRPVVVRDTAPAPTVAPAAASAVDSAAAAVAARPVRAPAPAATRPTPAPARPAAAAAVAATRTHRVEWAETWYGIARRYSVAPSAMAAANPDIDPERLRAGVVLRIPAADAAVARAEGATRSHKVGGGDTLWGIARRYGVSVERLRAANRLDGDRVRLGQTLTIPAPDPVR